MSLIASVLCAQFNQKKKSMGKKHHYVFVYADRKGFFFNVGGKIK